MFWFYYAVINGLSCDFFFFFCLKDERCGLKVHCSCLSNIWCEKLSVFCISKINAHLYWDWSSCNIACTCDLKKLLQLMSMNENDFRFFDWKKVKLVQIQVALNLIMHLPFQACNICTTVVTFLILHHRWPNRVLLTSAADAVY